MNDTDHSATGRSGIKLHPPFWFAGLGVLCIPAIAMLMTSEVHWGFGDFLIFGVMLTALIRVIEYAISRQTQLPYKALAVLASLIVLTANWVELTVGIFD